MHKVGQSKIVDIQSLPANPLLEAPFQKQTALQVKVFVVNKVYVVNTGESVCCVAMAEGSSIAIPWGSSTLIATSCSGSRREMIPCIERR